METVQAYVFLHRLEKRAQAQIARRHNQKALPAWKVSATEWAMFVCVVMKVK